MSLQRSSMEADSLSLVRAAVPCGMVCACRRPRTEKRRKGWSFGSGQVPTAADRETGELPGFAEKRLAESWTECAGALVLLLVKARRVEKRGDCQLKSCTALSRKRTKL